MNKKFLVRWVFDVPAIIAFGFRKYELYDIRLGTLINEIKKHEELMYISILRMHGEILYLF